jgi:hypothetical protein
MPWQKAPKCNYPTPKSHSSAPNVITRLVRVIQGHGKAKGVGSWIPRINQPKADKPGYDKQV